MLAYEHMPRAELTLKPRGRRAMTQTAKSSHTSETSKAHVRDKIAAREPDEELRPREDFIDNTRDTQGWHRDGDTTGDSRHSRRPIERPKDKDSDRER